MKEEKDIKPKYTDVAEASRIYFLPNLMTAGNLFCGFVAVIRCIQAKYAAVNPEATNQLYAEAVWFILAAVIFDILDGRLAKLGGQVSLFGKEFDSIADTVSFGMAPALLSFFLILSPTDQYPFFRNVGWLISFIYLLCATVRLARFNVITNPLLVSEKEMDNQDFIGLPVPAAAGTIASLVLVLNSYDLRNWAIFLPILLLLIAMLMISDISYPSFKNIDWRTTTRPQHFIWLFIFLALLYETRWIATSLVFFIYIFYGLFKHFYSKKDKVIVPKITQNESEKMHHRN